MVEPGSYPATFLGLFFIILSVKSYNQMGINVSLYCCVMKFSFSTKGIEKNEAK
ncbi:hypothetical protein LDC_1255 [sediment metagenome]|uniref:Uncharacterized protein n=1 Tax=sediment metagenome TaxID=749907 RepID=D9PI99_9ZZZZ